MGFCVPVLLTLSRWTMYNKYVTFKVNIHFLNSNSKLSFGNVYSTCNELTQLIIILLILLLQLHKTVICWRVYSRVLFISEMSHKIKKQWLRTYLTWGFGTAMPLGLWPHGSPVCKRPYELTWFYTTRMASSCILLSSSLCPRLSSISGQRGPSAIYTRSQRSIFNRKLPLIWRG